MNLQSKHNFTMAHFGLLLGVVKNNLQELQIQHCNDIFCRTHQVSHPDTRSISAIDVFLYPVLATPQTRSRLHSSVCYPELKSCEVRCAGCNGGDCICARAAGAAD